MKAIVKPHENVLPYLGIFQFLQKNEIKLIEPIDVTEILNPGKNVSHAKLPKVFLWNQLSDPNLGIHDFLKVNDPNPAEFRWVIVDGDIKEIQELLNMTRDPSEIELVEIINELHQQNKFPIYFIAEGIYEGIDGIHFCLTPYNDLVSCQMLNMMINSDFTKQIRENQNIDPNGFRDQIDLESILSCEKLFINHFQSTLRVYSQSN
jgi:hypothetical protein